MNEIYLSYSPKQFSAKVTEQECLHAKGVAPQTVRRVDFKGEFRHENFFQRKFTIYTLIGADVICNIVNCFSHFIWQAVPDPGPIMDK